MFYEKPLTFPALSVYFVCQKIPLQPFLGAVNVISIRTHSFWTGLIKKKKIGVPDYASTGEIRKVIVADAVRVKKLLGPVSSVMLVYFSQGICGNTLFLSKTTD